MQPDLFEHIIEQVKDVTPFPVRLHVDGEPTLHPHFFDYAKLLNKKGIPFGLATNGSLLSPQFLDLKMEIILSISTMEAEFHRRSKTLSYEAYINNILDYFRRWTHSQSEQTIYVQIPIYLNSVDELYMSQKGNFVRNCVSEMKIDQNSGATLYGNSELDMQVIKPNGSVMRFYYWRISETANYKDPTPSDRRVERGFCSMPWEEMAILADGRVTCCCSDLTGGTAFTEEKDIFDRPLLELWRNKKIIDVRNQFLQRKIALDVCKRCLATIPKQEFYSNDHPLGTVLTPKDENLFPVDSLGRSLKEKRPTISLRKILFRRKVFQAEVTIPHYNGWWFNPDESGTGVSIEVQSEVLFMAVFTYDEKSGDPVWYYSGGKMSDRFHYHGKLLRRARTVREGGDEQFQSSDIGTVDVFFLSQDEASLEWALESRKGTKKLVRFMDSVSPGSKDPRDIHGWWYDPDHNGMGFFMEAQGDSMAVAWYSYDDSGSPIWWYCLGHFPLGETKFTGIIKEFHHGQCLGCFYREPAFKELGEMRIHFAKNRRASLFWNGTSYSLERFSYRATDIL
jgi:MoaA/NifB/PqqE/SkfB family radical SAM enzyme